MAEPTYRMSMLPFGTYANPDGTESLGLAVPGMIQEPINALMRLAENSRLPDGRLGIPNPDNAQNREDILTGLLSMYGGNAMNPGRLMKGAAAKVEAPHVLDINKMLEAEASRTSDFSALAAGLRERGMLHPREPETTGLRPGLTVTREGAPGAASAWHDIALDGESIGRAYVREYPNSIQNSNFTLDPAFQRQGIGTEVQRELAQRYGKPTVPDSTLSEAAYQRWLKNDPAAVSDYAPWFEGSSQYSPIPDSSNYFSAMGRGPSPGTRGARGELFSDTGKPSLFGSAIAGAGKTERPTLDAPKVNIYDPPNMPKRAFEEDYPYGAPADPQGRLTHDIDGNPLNQNARYIVGRRMAEGEDQALPAAEFDALAKAITGSRAQAVSPREMGQDAGRTVVSKVDGRPLGIELRNDLSAEDLPRVYGHELGHVIDRTAAPFSGIPTSDATNPNRASLLSQEFGQVYHDLNSPDASLRGMALPERHQFSPANLNYAPEKWDAEFLSEALRAYMADPNYMKSVAPTVAQRIREYVNPHPELNGLIQFNSDNLPSLFGSALAPYQQEPQNALLTY